MKFTFEGRQVYYETYGSGKPIVILNGIMMSTASWQSFIEDFSANNQLVLVDFFDQGQSDRIPEGGYTHDIQVRLVEALLNHLNLAKANICGISYGGEVALEFACRYQDRVDKLVLFNTCAYTTPWLNDIGKAWIACGDSRDGIAYYNVAIPVIYSTEFYEKRLDWMRNREKVLVPLFSNPEFCDRVKRLNLSSEPYDVRPLLKDLEVKTLIISCEQDFLTPMCNQELMASMIKNSYVVKIPGVGHASMYEKPILFSTLALGFVNTVTDEYKI